MNLLKKEHLENFVSVNFFNCVSEKLSFSLSPYLIIILLFIGLYSCDQISSQSKKKFNRASENAKKANRGFKRCNKYLYDWLEYADSSTGLIPRDLYDSQDIWNIKDAAADHYPFMVLTASITDKKLYNGELSEILKTEAELTSRLGNLPDTYSFQKNGFEYEEIDTTRIIFGASEYIKDGLLPLTEWLGASPWSNRMLEMMDDIWNYASVQTEYGKIPTTNIEIHGEMLQALPRLYHMTGKNKYLDWAKRLSNYYLLGKGYPSFYKENIRLRDHGCEIISGLCEIYCSLSFTDPELKNRYKKPLYKLLDRILEVGRNKHGMFYNVVNLKSEEIVDKKLADTWGYTLNGYYTLYLIDKTEKYRKPVTKALKNLNNYKNYDWEFGSADGYADAIESALNLYNRVPLSSAQKWIDSQTEIMWSYQDSSHSRRRNAKIWKDSGIIEGWYGDGNFARTTIMYSLWKTKGLTIDPWKSSVLYGAVSDKNKLYVSIKSGKKWEGELVFDKMRYKVNMNLPLDYPRINQFPEWFSIGKTKKYKVTNITNNTTNVYKGKELLKGLDLKLDKNRWYYIKVKELKK